MLFSLSCLSLAIGSVLSVAIPSNDHSGIRLDSRKSSLPSTFAWSSTPPLISPPADQRHYAAFKDPSIVYYNGAYHLFVSTAEESGYNLAYLTFKDFNSAASAKPYYLDTTAIGTGYRAAPQVFFFEPQGLWYLIFQNGNAAYSTNRDISNPAGWTAPVNMFSGTPKIIQDNIGNGAWLDMWVICDAKTCYLFSEDDNGHLYRSETPLSSFPKGFTNTVIALEGKKNDVFEASNVYSVGDGTYLLIIEAIGTNGARYFRSWTSNSIAGTWTPLAATEAKPFAGAANVVFKDGTAWTKSISHGEMIRSGHDQTLAIDPCNLKYLYQGIDPKATGDYNALPWKLALLTQTNSAC